MTRPTWLQDPPLQTRVPQRQARGGVGTGQIEGAMGGGRDRGSGGMEGRTEREDGAKVGEDHTEDKRETEIQRDIHTE